MLFFNRQQTVTRNTGKKKKTPFAFLTEIPHDSAEAVCKPFIGPVYLASLRLK